MDPAFLGNGRSICIDVFILDIIMAYVSKWAITYHPFSCLPSRTRWEEKKKKWRNEKKAVIRSEIETSIGPSDRDWSGENVHVQRNEQKG